MISSAPASAQVEVDAEGPALDVHGIGSHQAQRTLVLRHRLDGAACESAGKIGRESDGQRERNAERNDHSLRDSHIAEHFDAGADIARLHHALVDAESEDQADLHDERDAEEKRYSPDALVGAAALEGEVVELVDRQAEHEEHRRQQEAREQRVHAVADQRVGRIRAEHEESRVRDVRHVEQPERDREPDADRSVEAAEEEP